ncbi:hypothetical protein E4663_08765 [Halobacillus salinus]|uniref:HTH merR-type domain-containing protein n=1 Tax=Halobacillus salinus TaxID=192814 RepID=A0A4Z0H6W1_9BACI|nr:hypothetical protein E4663_08765 [Halobacillus salinus]
MYKVSEFAKLTRLSKETLRYFSNLEELLLQKRQRMKRQIRELQERMKELDVFLQSGKPSGNHA